MAATTGTKAGGSTSRLVIGSKTESAWGTTPVGNYQAIRATGESLSVNEGTTQSEEIRADRQISDQIRTSFVAEGDINAELSRDTYDEYLKSALESDFATKTNVTTQLDFDTTSDTIQDFGANSAFANVSVGDIIRISGAANAENNGFKRVIAKTDANNVTVAENLVTETGSGDEVVEAATMRNGIAPCSFSLIAGYTDIDVYKLFTGMLVNNFSVDIGTGEVVTSTFSFIGKNFATSTTAPTTDAATTTKVFNSVDDFGGFAIDGTAQANLTSISLSTTNNASAQQVIGTSDAAGVLDGRFSASGSASLFLSNTDLLDKFINETEIRLQFELIDASGYGYVFHLPRVKIINAQSNAGGADETATVEFDYQALASTSAADGTSYTLQIARFTDV